MSTPEQGPWWLRGDITAYQELGREVCPSPGETNCGLTLDILEIDGKPFLFTGCDVCEDSEIIERTKDKLQAEVEGKSKTEDLIDLTRKSGYCGHIGEELERLYEEHLIAGREIVEYWWGAIEEVTPGEPVKVTIHSQNFKGVVESTMFKPEDFIVTNDPLLSEGRRFTWFIYKENGVPSSQILLFEEREQTPEEIDEIDAHTNELLQILFPGVDPKDLK